MSSRRMQNEASAANLALVPAQAVKTSASATAAIFAIYREDLGAQ